VAPVALTHGQAPAKVQEVGFECPTPGSTCEAEEFAGVQILRFFSRSVEAVRAGGSKISIPLSASLPVAPGF
jgi:hypothetical protein